jgi:hypothetical protein
MLRTIGYEFRNGAWVARWRWEGRDWIDLRYPQYNRRISGRFIETSFVSTPYRPLIKDIK